MRTTKEIGLRSAGGLFGVMAVAQLARVILQPEISVNGRRMPLWPSLIALPVLLAMSAWTLALACASRPSR